MAIELSNLRKDLLYTAQSPLANILDDLQQIAEIDQLSEMKQKEYGKKALFYFLGILTSCTLLFILLVASNNHPIFSLSMIGLFLVTLALIIACISALVKRSRYKKTNISNHRYDLTKQILQMLARDMDKASTFDLKLSFQPIEIDNNKIGTNPHPYKSGWKVDNYRHEWLHLQGQFLDKTRFNLSLTQLSKKEHGWKRGSSGKQKYKTKTKAIGLDVDLKLSYPQSRYGAIKVLQTEINSAVKLPQSSTLRLLKVTDKAINISARIAPQFLESQNALYETIAAIFLSCYQILNLAKLLSK
ncbi:conserved hypothetical protein [Trichormus variabilis ATCC 29413]|uniref:Uncharacterized protein n=3 Tax=Anabaena variabilis TaxID=264691 RepID=Q3MCY8_TRIV2|nr:MULTISPECIES: hypothetical protein [Nostocaceae]ABA21148.1 conserved hypothetical protein [Trichormus variabilis ATCC 29413]